MREDLETSQKKNPLRIQLTIRNNTFGFQSIHSFTLAIVHFNNKKCYSNFSKINFHQINHEMTWW